MDNNAKRVFIALNVPKQITCSIYNLLHSFLKNMEPNLRSVNPNNYHFTLMFLGLIKENKIAILKQVLQKACKDLPKFEIQLKGIGCFPQNSNPRNIWLGVKKNQSLENLRQQIEKQVYNCFPGVFNSKNAFSAHLTLGRVRNPLDLSQKTLLQKYLQDYSNYNFGSFIIEYASIMQSVLKKEGPKYLQLEKIFLQNQIKCGK